MTDILLAILLTSLITNGLIISTSAGMILHPVRRFLEWIFVKRYEVCHERCIDGREMIQTKSKLANPKIMWIYKPILYCASCMPSIYGTAICFLMFPMSYELIYQIPLVVFGSVTLSPLINQQYI